MALLTNLNDNTDMANRHADQHNQVNQAVLTLQTIGTGPQGPQGPPGATGPQGPAGPTSLPNGSSALSTNVALPNNSFLEVMGSPVLAAGVYFATIRLLVGGVTTAGSCDLLLSDSVSNVAGVTFALTVGSPITVQCSHLVTLGPSNNSLQIWVWTTVNSGGSAQAHSVVAGVAAATEICWMKVG